GDPALGGGRLRAGASVPAGAATAGRGRPAGRDHRTTCGGAGMTVDLQLRTEQPAPRKRRVRMAPQNLVLLSLGAFLVLSAVRTLTGGYDLTSSGTIAAGLSAAVPIGLAGLGGLWSERAGVVNIGLEGMMILGTWGCAYLGWNHGPWAGVLFGTLLGALGGLVHAVATVTFGVDHIISGVAVNIIAPGFALYLTKITFAHDP